MYNLFNVDEHLDHCELFPGEYIERDNSMWSFRKTVGGVIDDDRRKELHYIVLATGKCIAVILNSGENWMKEKRIEVKESIEVDQKTLPVVGIWLTYTNKTPDNVVVVIPKTVEYVHPVIDEGHSEYLNVRFEVDDQNPCLSSGEDGCLYDKQQSKLLLYGGDHEKWMAPDTLVSMAETAFHGVRVDTLVFPSSFTILGKEWKDARCFNLDFHGQLSHIDTDALDNINGTFKMNGLFSLLDVEGQNTLKQWHEGSNEREHRYRDVVLAAPTCEKGAYEDGIITLTQVFDLDRKLHERLDSSSIQLNVNINKELCETEGAGISILVDSVTIDDESGYRSEYGHLRLKPLYQTTRVTRIRFVPLSKPQEPQILELLVHEPEEEVKALLQQAYKA